MRAAAQKNELGSRRNVGYRRSPKNDAIRNSDPQRAFLEVPDSSLHCFNHERGKQMCQIRFVVARLACPRCGWIRFIGAFSGSNLLVKRTLRLMLLISTCSTAVFLAVRFIDPQRQY